jgi:hypothetical protein
MTTRKTPLSAIGDVIIPLASQSEAEAGTNPTKRMSPLTTKQSIAAQVGVTVASKSQGDKADTALQVTTGDLISVQDVRKFGASAASSDNTAFFTAWKAGASGTIGQVPPASAFKVDEAFTFDGMNVHLLKGAKITDLAGNTFDDLFHGAYSGEFLTPDPRDNTNRIRSDFGELHIADKTMTLSGLRYDHTNNVYRYIESRVGTDPEDTAYYVSGAAYWAYSPIGMIAESKGERQAGSSTMFGGLMYLRSAGDASKPGRSEFAPISLATYCGHDSGVTQQKINIYLDWNASGPSNEEERFLAVHNSFLRKFHPGDTYDADHNGSFGYTISTKPGNDGFGVPATAGLRTYPIRAGYAVSGHSGLLAEAPDGDSPLADLGFKYGFLAGGSNNVYLTGETTGSSKIGVGFAAKEYTVAGLQLFNKHINADANVVAIQATSSAGPSLFGINTFTDYVTPLQAGFAAGAGSNALRLRANNDAGKRTTAIFGDEADGRNWVLGRDLFAANDGSFGLYGGTTPDQIFRVGLDKRIQLFNLPTSSAGLPAGTVWKNGNVLNIV